MHNQCTYDPITERHSCCDGHRCTCPIETDAEKIERLTADNNLLVSACIAALIWIGRLPVEKRDANLVLFLDAALNGRNKT